MKHDPPRFLEQDSQVDSLLRDALQAGRARTPSAAQLQSLALKVELATAATASTAAVTKTSWLSSAQSIAKLSIGLLVAGTGTWLALRSMPTEQAPNASNTATPAQLALVQTAPVAEHAASAPPARAHSQRHAAQNSITAEAVMAEPVERAPSRGEGIDAPVANPPSLAATRGKTTAPALVEIDPTPNPHPSAHRTETVADEPSVSGPGPKHRAASELSLLGQAQDRIAHDPAGALDLLAEHARLYPRGSFAEERKALSIDALRRLGRTQEMRERASEFLKRYPVSVHRDLIMKWLE